MTKGQPLVFQKVKEPRKLSSLTNSPVRRKRVKGVEQFCGQIAGTSEKDIGSQHVTEEKGLRAKQRKTWNQLLA